MFNIIIRSVSFALALAAGLALSTAYAIEAEAATFSSNAQVEVRELNPVCRVRAVGEGHRVDTVYRLLLVNDSAMPRTFWATDRWSKTVQPGERARFRYRLRDGDPGLDFAVTHRAEVLAYGVDRVDVCS